MHVCSVNSSLCICIYDNSRIRMLTSLYPLPQEAYGLEFFEKVALLLYELLETFKQYKRYIQYVDFIDLTPPTPGPQELFLTPTPSTTVLPQASEYTHA